MEESVQVAEPLLRLVGYRCQRTPTLTKDLNLLIIPCNHTPGESPARDYIVHSIFQNAFVKIRPWSRTFEHACRAHWRELTRTLAATFGFLALVAVFPQSRA